MIVTGSGPKSVRRFRETGLDSPESLSRSQVQLPQHSRGSRHPCTLTPRQMRVRCSLRCSQIYVVSGSIAALSAASGSLRSDGRWLGSALRLNSNRCSLGVLTNTTRTAVGGGPLTVSRPSPPYGVTVFGLYSLQRAAMRARIVRKAAGGRGTRASFVSPLTVQVQTHWFPNRLKCTSLPTHASSN
jgi:hypothetical protein